MQLEERLCRRIWKYSSHPPKNAFSCCTFDNDGAQTHANQWWRNSQHTFVTRRWWVTSCTWRFSKRLMQLTLMQIAPPTPSSSSIHEGQFFNPNVPVQTEQLIGRNMQVDVSFVLQFVDESTQARNIRGEVRPVAAPLVEASRRKYGSCDCKSAYFRLCLPKPELLSHPPAVISKSTS